MGIILMIIGYGWALIGVANLFTIDWATTGETLAGMALIINVILFILPGAVVGALGQKLNSR